VKLADILDIQNVEVISITSQMKKTVYLKEDCVLHLVGLHMLIVMEALFVKPRLPYVFGLRLAQKKRLQDFYMKLVMKREHGNYIIVIDFNVIIYE